MKFVDRIWKFIIKNPDLISEYESLENAISLEGNLIEIAELCEKYIKNHNINDVNGAIRSAFNISIKSNVNILEAFDSLLNHSNSYEDSYNSTQQYFKEINDIYVKNNHNYDIEYCPENRDKLIEMNLKSVISIAKKYTKQ